MDSICTTLLASLIVMQLCASGCATSAPVTPSSPSPQPATPSVDDAYKADLEFFCAPLSDALMNTPEQTFTQTVFVHWTDRIESREVLRLIDTVTDPSTIDPLTPIEEATSKAGLSTCPVTSQLFVVEEPVEDESSTATPRVATSDAQMRDALRQVVQSNVGDLQSCYKDELRVSPEFDGRMKLGITIGEKGTVTEVSVEYNEAISPRDEFTSCLYNEVLMWTFPIPPEPPMKVVYPLKFTS